MGKVLVEKLLRSCPDIERLYLVVRPKAGKLPSDRILAMRALPVGLHLRKIK